MTRLVWGGWRWGIRMKSLMIPATRKESATSRFPPSRNHGENEGYENLHVFFPKSHVFKAVNQCCSDKVFPKWWQRKNKVFRKKVIYQEHVFSIKPNEEYQTILSLPPKKWGGVPFTNPIFFVASPSPSCHRLTLTRSYEYVLSLSPSHQLPNRQGAAVCQECLQVCEFVLNAFSFLMIKVT